MKLLEKVEELTLYVIAQHRAIGALEGRLEELEGELAEARRWVPNGESSPTTAAN
jgi:hypothetical protein